MDWTSGYVAEIDYTYGYYRELAPGLIDFSLLTSGHLPPRRAGMRYLELGYRAVRAQSGVPGVKGAYGVGRGQMFYEPADAALPTDLLSAAEYEELTKSAGCVPP